VRIEDPGDSNFLEGEQVDKITLREEQERVKTKAGSRPRSSPFSSDHQGFALEQSFISAASFQETTRVLTEASIRGAVDPLRGSRRT